MLFRSTVMSTVDVDLDDIVRSVVNSARAGDPSAQIETELEPVRLQANADAVTRIVTNLVDNAVGHGGGRVRVSLARGGTAPDGGTGAGGSEAILRVDDNGPGIVAEERQSIFERFSRLDPSRNRVDGGTGLGLAIVHDLVVGHNGTITVSSSDLGGASFEVRLPLP